MGVFDGTCVRRGEPLTEGHTCVERALASPSGVPDDEVLAKYKLLENGQTGEQGDTLNFLRDSKLRTQQLKYLNLQRAKGLKWARENINFLKESGIAFPEVRSRSILVRHLRYEFREPTHCKWCEEALTAESLALTFDQSLYEGGSAEIENVVAICKQCFFHKGGFPQWFWAKLIGWLRQEGLLGVYRSYAATWAQKAAYREHWAAKYSRGRRRM
jgi:hypothetical protein